MPEGAVIGILHEVKGVGMIDQRAGRNPKYVNHAEEMAAWSAVLDGVEGLQYLVLEGIPGVGKSATVTEFSYWMESRYPDGCLVADLTGTIGQDGAEADALYGFLLALDVAPNDIPDRVDARRVLYRNLTGGRRFQVILDGAKTAAQVRTLLPGPGDSLVLVTEAGALGALATDRTPITAKLEPLSVDAAVDLLARVVEDEGRVAAEPEAVAEVVELCWRLPIALCVVGAMVGRSASRTFESMVERLQDERHRLTALSGKDLCVRAAFNAAYRQLGDTAQVCYRTLGLRPRTSEISVDALTAVLRVPRYEVVDAMNDLADARLVEDIRADRFRVREMVQVHAADLDTREVREKEAEVVRLLEFYHQRTIDADALLSPSRPWRADLLKLRARRSFQDAEQARTWLHDERHNLLAALEFMADAGETERVVQWCVLLWPFYEKEKHLVDDLFAVHRFGLKACRSSDSALRSLLHTQKGYGHYWLRDLDDAVTEFQAGLRFAREAANDGLEATAAEGLGLAEYARGDVERARELLRRCLEIALGIGDSRRTALARFHLAKPENPDAALELLAQAEATFAEGDAEKDNLAKVSLWRGKKLLDLNDLAAAETALDSALKSFSVSGRGFDEAETQEALGDLAAALGDLPNAASRYDAAVSYYERHGFTALTNQVLQKLKGPPA